MHYWIHAIKEWQTLVAGLMAILGAFVGGGAVWYQTYLIEKREQCRLDHQHSAARAVLPLALDALVSYAHDCGRSLFLLLSSTSTTAVRPCNIVSYTPPPALNPAVISDLRDVIESSKQPIRHAISHLLINVQWLSARLRGIGQNIIPGSVNLVTIVDLEDIILIAASIYARGEDLFAYARQETDIPPPLNPTEERMHTALTMMGFHRQIHQRLFDMAAQRIVKGRL